MDCKHDHGQIYSQGRWICKNCGVGKDGKAKRALTEYEKMKLSWYRDEKKWVNNIRDRHIVRDKSGNLVSVSEGKVMPTQPRELWPEARKR